MSNPPIVPARLDGAPLSYHVRIEDPDGNVVYSGLALLRQYQTGSWGWHDAGKFDISGTDGERAQVDVGLTVIGSKGWPIKGLDPDANGD